MYSTTGKGVQHPGEDRVSAVPLPGGTTVVVTNTTLPRGRWQPPQVSPFWLGQLCICLEPERASGRDRYVANQIKSR